MNERIVIDPEIQHGKPVNPGTRVPITRIVGGLAGGMTKEEIIREYELTKRTLRPPSAMPLNSLKAKGFILQYQLEKDMRFSD